ncbi:cytochrome b/b6 domain-containing protein [Acidithiobacillus sp. IBUN Pt1247-S3]|uniref:cytochrome b/b6 domain-containing protein n=1 Tax=Acidithiobacillus sp. IBUN Pt1247-S3 TaxID=3166642 RepID=UPI0034E37BF5
MENSVHEWPRHLRWLHTAFAVLITFQLLSELDMHAIWKSVGVTPLQHGLFVAHMAFGALAFGVITLFWWQIIKNPALRRHLFPYAGVHGARIFSDIEGVIRGELPAGGLRGGLPGMVHGGGILVVTAMAISGVIMLMLILSAGLVKPAAFWYQPPHYVHSLLSNLLWAYWVGHVFMALAHSLQNSRILRIFVP